MNKIVPFLIIPLVLIGCSDPKSFEVNETEARESARYDLAITQKMKQLKRLPYQAINPENEATDEKIKLGHALYFENELSLEGNNSCNSCHDLAAFGVDNLPTSPGDAGETGDRNSPTVLNAALHSSQFWDGRAKDLEEQAGMPIMNPVEMAIPSEQFLVDRLTTNEYYQELFKKAFPNEENPISYTNLRKAIAVFERQLLTPSRYDAYLKGDVNALSVQEKKGLMSFASVGCMTCHNGALLGGTMLQKFGVHKDYWTLTGSKHIDLGKASQTGEEYDKYVFKVPSLRNIAKTAPYFHDGSVKDLSEAVKIMADAQLNYKLSEDELSNIVAFLGALTGEVPVKYQTAPSR